MRSIGSRPGRRRPIGTKWVPLLLLAPLVSGCQKDDVADAAPSESSSELLLPELRIDGNAANLVPVSWMGVAGNGTMAVGQMQRGNLQFFDSLGVHLGSFGRRGSGPGEFERPVRGGWLGDTLWISDTQLRRITLISPERQLVRTLPPLTAAHPSPANANRFPTFGLVFPYGLLRNDLLITTAVGASGDPLAEAFEGTPLLRVTAEGVIEDLLTEIPPNPCSVNVTFPDGSASAQVPFCASPLWGISPDGARVAILTADITGPEGGTFRVSVFDSQHGSRIFDRAYPFQGVPIPRAVVDSVMNDRIARTQIPELRHALEGAAKDRIPPVYAPAWRVILGADGRVLVGLRGDSSGNSWMILDVDGEVADRFTVPSNVVLHVADTDHVWGVERDEVDVESIVRFRLTGRQ